MDIVYNYIIIHKMMKIMDSESCFNTVTEIKPFC